MQKVLFRCKRSGNTVGFTLPGDIDGMRLHEGYQEITQSLPDAVKVDSVKEAPKGRKVKSTIMPSFLQD